MTLYRRIACSGSESDRQHPVGDAFRKEITLCADDLNAVGVLNSGTDSNRLADGVFSNVLAWRRAPSVRHAVYVNRYMNLSFGHRDRLHYASGLAYDALPLTI
jgi:hypothetical protein